VAFLTANPDDVSREKFPLSALKVLSELFADQTRQEDRQIGEDVGHSPWTVQQEDFSINL